MDTKPDYEPLRVIIAAAFAFAWTVLFYYKTPAPDRGPVWLLSGLQAGLTFFVWLLMKLTVWRRK